MVVFKKEVVVCLCSLLCTLLVLPLPQCPLVCLQLMMEHTESSLLQSQVGWDLTGGLDCHKERSTHCVSWAQLTNIDKHDLSDAEDDDGE